MMFNFYDPRINHVNIISKPVAPDPNAPYQIQIIKLNPGEVEEINNDHIKIGMIIQSIFSYLITAHIIIIGHLYIQKI